MSTEKLNLYQKLLEISDMAGVLKKDKAGYNFNYTSEDEVLAKVTAGMQKFQVALIPEIVPNTMNVMPYQYKRYNRKTTTEEDVFELIVYADMAFTWINAEKPDDKIRVGWAMCGQMDDVSQAFGGGLTYANRYYLLKALQLATVEDDPDNYRSKQKETSQYHERELLKAQLAELKEVHAQIINECNKKINEGVDKDVLYNIIAEHSETKSKNPNSIKNIETANNVLETIKNISIEGVSANE